MREKFQREPGTAAEPHRAPPASPGISTPAAELWRSGGDAPLSLSRSRSRSLAYVLGCCGGSVFTSSL